LEQGRAGVFVVDRKQFAQSAIPQANAPIRVDHGESVAHRAKNRANIQLVLARAFREFLLTEGHIFEGNADALRGAIPVDEKSSRIATVDHIVDELLHVFPWSQPQAPETQRSATDDEATDTRDKPNHPPLPFAKPIAKAAHGFDKITALTEFLT
jgi:hypothetical protein